MSEKYTIAATAADMYQIGDTLRISDHAPTWWEIERPFFPVVLIDKCATVDWVETKNAEVTVQISDEWDDVIEVIHNRRLLRL